MKKAPVYIILTFFLLTIRSGSLQSQPMPFIDNRPRVTGWADDTHFLFRTFDKDQKPVTERVDIRSGKSEVIVPEPTEREKLEKLLPAGIKTGRNDIISPDGKSIVLFRENDLWIFSAGDKELTRLTKDTIPEMNFRFSPDGKKIAFTKNRDLYVYNLNRQKELRLTFDASDKVYNGWSSWVYMEEILGRASRYTAFWWSPDGSKLAFFRFDDTPVPVFTLNRLDEADGNHGILEPTPYPKPGDPNPEVRMGIADVATLKTVWVKTDPGEDHYLGWPFWTPDSKKIAVQVLNRDQNDMQFLLADGATGDVSEIYRETNKTWVDFFEDVYVLKNGSGFLLRSSRSGWENLYYYDWNGKLICRLTDTEWRVNEIKTVDEDHGYVCFTGTGPEATDKHAFRVGLDGKGLMQITSGEGSHEVLISPDGSYFIDTRSSTESPGAIVAIDKKGKLVREIHRFDHPAFDPEKHSKTVLAKIPTSDGKFMMPALITFPLNFDSTRQYPVIFTIYGGPNSGMVFNSWKGTTPTWYAENGIITLSVDHRGSGKFGKKGLDYLYRNLGKWELSDYADAVKWLRKKPYVDPERMGITGSSYGGYVTCMALTQGAEYWTHGIAGSSVTDWRLYDNVYTERYMDTPQQNPEGYKEGSALSYVKDFKGKLLITHGDMDDNVHLQNSIWLISKLEDAGKQFEFMLYPGGRHGWGGEKRTHSVNEAHRFWLESFGIKK